MKSIQLQSPSFFRTLRIAPLSVFALTSISESAVVAAVRSTDNVIQGNFEAGGSSVFLLNN